MSKATPEAVQAVFHPDSIREEVAHLNRLLDDSNLTISSLFQLLRDHNVPVGSTELIKAREKGEAEMQTLRAANAGLVEKVKRLEEALVEVEAVMKQPASNYRLMQIAGPARQVINIVKQAKEAKP